MAAKDTEMIYEMNEMLDKRPLALTVICILGFIGAVLSVPMIFSDVALQIGSWFPPYAGFATLVSVISMYGLWHSRKWGLHIYSVFVLINQIVLIKSGDWSPIVFIAQASIVLIVCFQLEEGFRALLKEIILYLKRKIIEVVIAYMIGIHNFYKEEQKDPDDIVFTIDSIEEDENERPGD